MTTIIPKQSVNVNIAREVGERAAVLFGYILALTDESRALGQNEHDGHYWACIPRIAFLAQFPYLSKQQVRTTINRLMDAGLIVEGCYNDDPRDRTRWYAVTEKGYDIIARG